MRKAKVFYGPPGGGKTFKAKELAKGRNTITHGFNQIDDHFLYLEPETQVLIIEEVPLTRLEDLIPLIKSKTMQVNKRGKEPFHIDTPEILITTQADGDQVARLKYSKLGKRFEFIRCCYKDEIEMPF